MRASYRTASQADLFRTLANIHRSESRTGSHDNTGAGATIWQHRHNAGWVKHFEIRPQEDVYAWWSVQNSQLSREHVPDDWDKLLEAWRNYASAPLSRRGYHLARRRQMRPSEDAMIEYAVIADGRYHYGSSIRARCSIEVWRREHADDQVYYDVLHLEHVGEAWGFVQEFLDYPPSLLLGLASVDAFKEYKR